MKKLLLLFVLFALPCVMFAQVTVSIATQNVSCNSMCNGSATATANGGTPPYTYQWTPSSATTPTVTNLCAGNYTVIVTDQLGGTATASCVIAQPTALTVTGFPNPSSTICAGTNVSFMLTVTGGTAPYTFSWSFPGATPPTSTVQNPTVLYSTPGNYNAICTVVDAAGCVAGVTITITVSSGPTVTITEIPSTCNMSNGTLNAAGAQSYAWQPGNLTGATVSNVTPNVTYTCTATNFMGCTSSTTFMTTDSCDYVWPGDANDDAVADNVDILDIGIANGATGTTRASATTTWIGQPSTPWGQTLLSGTDYKWVDCDGNGSINPVDTMAVVLNYGMTHSNRLTAPTYSSVGPDISLVLGPDSIAAGSTATMSIHLGSASNPANGVYGLAFRLNYDATEISTPSIGLSGAATWFGTPGSDQMSVALHPNAAMGYVDVAITRLDQQDVSGQGLIGSIYFTATNNQVGSGGAAPVAFTISNVVLVSSTGSQLPINSAIGDTVEVCDPPIITGITESQSSMIAVFPNPANEILQVQILSGGSQVITIEDLSGRVVYARTHTSGLSSIPVAELPAGMYVLNATDANGNKSTQKISIAR